MNGRVESRGVDLTFFSKPPASFAPLPVDPAVWFTHWFKYCLNGEMRMSTFKKFFNDESGATAIEYGLIAAGIAVVIITVLGSIGTNLTAKFQEVADELAK